MCEVGLVQQDPIFPFGNGNARRRQLFKRIFLADLCRQCRRGRTSGKHQRMLRHHHSNPMFCHGCQGKHSSVLFSARQRALSLQEGSRPVCVVHEGSVRLCPHRTIKYRKLWKWVQPGTVENHVLWECQRCFQDLGPSEPPTSVFRDGTHQPRVVVSDCWGIDDITDRRFTSRGLLRTWELPVFKISRLVGNEVPETLAIDGLEAAQLRYRGLACPHLRFNDGQLLRELECRGSCCLGFFCPQKEFTNETGQEAQSHAECQAEIAAIQATCPLHEHRDNSNCACEWPWEARLRSACSQEYKGASTAFHKKMLEDDEASLKAYDSVLGWVTHRVCCKLCNAEYRWIRRGNEF
ncbi:hypothetical protein V8F33_008322 [Rhypophila sp. PSN 637]